ncbi:unnamed protein product [marine sediment metagenome]|uniref:Uncharacterized protein n=1 Tax=marine sediment metagenome TaxID=412755 RepID=X1CKJ2_9ZZZZ
MSKVHPLDEKGCRLLSSRQWKQLRERVFLRPEDTADQLQKHYFQQPPRFRTGKLAFQPTVAEWSEAIARQNKRPVRFQ